MSTPPLLTYGFGVIVEPATAIKRTATAKHRAKDKITTYPTPRLLRVPVLRSSPLLTITFPSLKEMKLRGTIAAPYRSGCEPVHR